MDRVAIESPKVPVLLVRAGGRCCALPLSSVVETMRPLPLELFAGAPSFVLGVSRIRGRQLPVVDLSALLAELLPESGSHLLAEKNRLVVVRSDGGEYALAVEGVEGVMAGVSGLPMPRLLRGAASDRCAALGDLDRELLLLLETSRLWEQRSA